MSVKGLGLAGKTAAHFIHSKLTPLFILGAILLGAWAINTMPREEEPQIRVPFVDVFVQMPGAAPGEVEQRVTYPLERLLREIPGVEHLYSTSSPGLAMVVVRFQVGLDVQRSLTQVYTKLYAHLDEMPPGASPPLVKLRSIYDVPVLALTLSGPNFDGYQLRRVADELGNVIRRVPDVSAAEIIGGRERQLRVVLHTSQLIAYHLAPDTIVRTIAAADRQVRAGSFSRDNQDTVVYAGSFLNDVQELANVVVGVTPGPSGGQPVLLRQVATVSDGPAAASDYVRFTPGAGVRPPGAVAASPLPAVTIAISKLEGTNAIQVVDNVLRQVAPLHGRMIPTGVQLTVTRNYGETARTRSNTLLFHMLLATVSVIILIGLALGWRESGVVAVAIPVTLLLTLFLFYLYGYTLNRITLFALIFSIGILVDDAIVVVENIARHWHLPENSDRPLATIAVEAVAEVGNPTILATFTVIAALLPMAFVGGLMGPYMRPIPIGASAAMLFSLISAFVIAPWAALRFLGGARRPAAAPRGPEHHQPREDFTTRLYRRIMDPLLRQPRYRWFFLGGVVLLLLASLSMIYFKAVIVKMLPFDNKDEMEVVLQMPDGTPLEQTQAVAQRLSAFLSRQPEVANVESYVGAAAPYNFNGLIRHYFLRTQPNQADLQVNLVGDSQRRQQSHAIALRLRPGLDAIATPLHGRVTVAEIPPGPPVLQTLVAEVYGPDYAQQIQLAARVKQVFASTPGVVDVDWFVRDPERRLTLAPDPQKAALSGVALPDVAETLQIALQGRTAGLAHMPREQEAVPIRVQLARADRSGVAELLRLDAPAAGGQLVPLSELVTVQQGVVAQPLMHKDLRPVVYVLGDVAGGAESPAYAIFAMNKKLAQLTAPDGRPPAIFMSGVPQNTRSFAVRWDGEWDTTIRVFRDLGIAFAAVMVLIYVLVVFWFRSYKTPLVILAPIPLTLIGILPAHWALGAFFTATSMIGFIAGAGIIVRNSIILVDFIELRRAQGSPLAQAVVDAGAVRFRPMLLTAAAVIVGASVILPDPIFQGLAISLMAGEIASTLISRLAVPVLYFMAWRGSEPPPASLPA
ncbi:MAG TPA: efflux RND transporter permease subunit [Terriglobales bacterium]|nr:efflux RND transporter permease subunit [Terriglobales bacterium]